MLHSYIKSSQNPPNNVSQYYNTHIAMELTYTNFYYLGSCLEGFFFGMISVDCQTKLPFAKAVQHCAITGIYSGIFVMYLQHRGSQQNTHRVNNILFYALWVLYALNMATIIVDTLGWIDAVSVDEHRCLTLFQLVLQSDETVYHIKIIHATIFALCDVIAQSILVRTTDNCYHYSSDSSKDISLLDCLGL